MKVLSLFDGMSCGRVALERAGFEVSRYVAYEIDPSAILVSQWNYPDIEQMGSVVGADFTQYRGFDIVIGGFPCTDLSIGKTDRQGLAGQHSRLFWEQVRAIQEIKPKYFLVENNYGMPAKDEAIITETLGVKPVYINSATVSAQNRKRLYWSNIPHIETPEDKGIFLRDIIVNGQADRDKSLTVTTRVHGGPAVSHYFQKSLHQIVVLPAGSAFRNWPRNTKDGRFRRPEIRKDGKSNALTSVNTDCMVCDEAQGGYTVRGGIMQYGDKQVNVALPDGTYAFRKLTAVECERLQTLPDGYTEVAPMTQRYKMLGNGWTVDVIAHIFKHIHIAELM